MHFHAEIIIPPTEDVDSAVAALMHPFDEGRDFQTENDAYLSKYAFWDWYVIGGRWSGAKLRSRLGSERVAAFVEMLRSAGVTVSCVQAGKPSLYPESQVPEVDRLWREAFPESGLSVCPLFDHASDQVSTDICTVKDIPDDLFCERVLIAAPAYGNAGAWRVGHMLSMSLWNGVTHVPAAWDGSVKAALTAYCEDEHMRPERCPADDWLCVTVDCHS